MYKYAYLIPAGTLVVWRGHVKRVAGVTQTSRFEVRVEFEGGEHLNLRRKAMMDTIVDDRDNAPLEAI